MILICINILYENLGKITHINVNLNTIITIIGAWLVDTHASSHDSTLNYDNSY